MVGASTRLEARGLRGLKEVNLVAVPLCLNNLAILSHPQSPENSCEDFSDKKLPGHPFGEIFLWTLQIKQLTE